LFIKYREWFNTSCEATGELPSILQFTKFHFRLHKSSPIVPILSRANPVHATLSLQKFRKKLIKNCFYRLNTGNLCTELVYNIALNNSEYIAQSNLMINELRISNNLHESASCTTMHITIIITFWYATYLKQEIRLCVINLYYILHFLLALRRYLG
jgi:hypothetical protein